MEQTELLPGEAEETVEARRAARRAERATAAQKAEPRLVAADRSQIELRPLDLESLIPPNHRARSIWAVVEQLDLSAFYEPIKARGSWAGRPPTDPKVLLALWLFATAEGIGSARLLDRLCNEHAAYRWLRGGVPVNHHSLSDFRIRHEKALDGLFTQLLATMMQQGLVSLKRVAQDGTRVRASAGAGSFRRRERLEALLKLAQEQVEVVKKQSEENVDPYGSTRRKAAQERAARERAERVKRALEELAAIEQQRAEASGGHKPKGEPRASVTDPDARKMKMADGGFRPAYNAQLAVDTASRVITGVALTEDGTDYAHAGPMVDQIQERADTKPEELLTDGGYSSKDVVEAITKKGVRLYAPIPERKDTPDRFAIKPTDSEAVRTWKERMASEAGQAIYRERGATVETVNGDLKTWRTLGRFLVRGKDKAHCVLLWNVLAYNVLRWLALAPSG